MSALARSPRAAALSLITLALALAAPSASAEAELVSRIGGEGSLPFPAQLTSASSNGRFVVMHLGTPNFRAQPTGPEADITSPSGYVVRDRTLQTVTPIDIGIPDAAIGQISADGKRVVATVDNRFYVVDLATKQQLALPTAPGIVTGLQLSDDGTQAVVATTGTDTMNNPEKDNAIYRGPIGGAGTEVVKLYGVRFSGASRDLQTVYYTRSLPKVTAPDDAAKSFTPTIIGAKQGAGAPHVIAQSSFRQRREPSDICTPESIRTIIKQVRVAGVSGDGGRVAMIETGSDSAYYPIFPHHVRVRKAGGSVNSLESVGRYNHPEFEALGDSHDILLAPYITYREVPTAFHRIFADGDRLLISSDQGSGIVPGPQPTRYVTAEAYDPGAATAPSTLTFTADEPVDSAAQQGDVVFKSCADPVTVLPVGKADQYLNAVPSVVARSNASLGTVTLVPRVDGFRPIAKGTAEVKVFGITIWKRTLEPWAPLTLPRPWLWIPTTVKLTLQPEPGDGGAAAAPVVKQWTVTAAR